MSYFGDDTFAQDILDEVGWAMSKHGKTRLDAIRALSEIVDHLAEQVPDEVRQGDAAVHNAAEAVYRDWAQGEVSAASMRALGRNLGLEPGDPA